MKFCLPTEDRKYHKQAATEGSCSEDLVKHLQGRTSELGDVHRCQKVIDRKECNILTLLIQTENLHFIHQIQHDKISVIIHIIMALTVRMVV